MIHTKPHRIAFLCVTLGLAATVVECATAGTLDGLYVAGNYGRARSSYDPNFVDGQFESEASAVGDVLDYGAPRAWRTSTAWWAHAGYWLGPHWGIDAAFLHLGEFKTAATGTLESFFGSESLTSGAEVTSHGPALSVVGRLPLTEAMEVDLRAGDYFGKTTETTGLLLNSSYTTQPSSSTRSSLLVGAGAGYTLGDHLSIRLDYLFVARAGNATVGRYNVSLPSVGLSFTF